MDKYVELFCKQNPKMTIKCNNPSCDYECRVNSYDVFKEKEYALHCPKCNKNTIYDSHEFADDFKRQLNAMGIFLK